MRGRGNDENAGRWRSVDGLPLYSRELTGQAPPGAIPFVLLHGYGIAGRSMLPAALALAPFHPCYVPDLPGHGRSASPAVPLTVDGLASWLPAYLDELGLDRVALMGSSVGCLVALEFAARCPDRVRALVLIAPVGGSRGPSLPALGWRLLRDGLREPPGLLRIAVEDYVRFGPRNALSYLRGMRDFVFPARLGPAHGRVVVILGERDLLVDRAAALHRGERGADILVATVAGAAHAPNFSHPSQVTAVAMAFLDGSPVDEPGITLIDFRAPSEREP